MFGRMPDLHFAGHAMSLGFDHLATVPGLSTQTAPLRILTQPRGSIQPGPEAEVEQSKGDDNYDRLQAKQEEDGEESEGGEKALSHSSIPVP